MEKDIIVTCPYNKAHRIRRFKLMSHMVKCKKQHNTTCKVACPLNSSHVIDHSDIRDHLSTCSHLPYLIQNNVEEKVDTKPIMDVNIHETYENWDEAPEIPTYDAIANAASKNVIRCVNGGMTKSERLKYRLNERERIANLNAVSGTVERTRPLHKETIHEIAVRPPSDIVKAKNNTCNIVKPENNTHDITQPENNTHDIAQANNNSMEVNQQDINKSAQKENSSESLTKSTTTKEFRDIFQKSLYDELLPDNTWNDITFNINESQCINSEDYVSKTSNSLQKLLECTMASKDTSYKSLNFPNPIPGPSTRDQFEMLPEKESGKEKSFSSIHQTREARGKKEQKNVIEVDAFCDILGANTSKRETENTHNANISSERITDKLLALLTQKTEEVKLSEERKENHDNNEKNENNCNSELENMVHKLRDQVHHLSNAHCIVAEENARLAKELSDLKQKSCCNTKSSSIMNNPRCAANFTELPLNTTYSTNHNVPEEAHTSSFLENRPNSYNADRVDDMFYLGDNSEFPKLKTPKDFSRH